jgi:hypothetical protein
VLQYHVLQSYVKKSSSGCLHIAGDNLFFRAWQFQLPRAILSVPQALVEAMVWSIISYWLIGLAPDAGRWANGCLSFHQVSLSFHSCAIDTVACYLSCRFFIYWLVNALMHYNSVALFRVMGAFSQTASYANATACAPVGNLLSPVVMKVVEFDQLLSISS